MHNVKREGTTKIKAKIINALIKFDHKPHFCERQTSDKNFHNLSYARQNARANSHGSHWHGISRCFPEKIAKRPLKNLLAFLARNLNS